MPDERGYGLCRKCGTRMLLTVEGRIGQHNAYWRNTFGVQSDSPHADGTKDT